METKLANPRPIYAALASLIQAVKNCERIAESMDYPDDGQWEVVGRLWWFPDYMIRSPLDELIRRGRTVFKAAS